MTGESEPTLHEVRLTLCSLCLDGAGGECHTPACALWINRAPDLPLRDHPFVHSIDGMGWSEDYTERVQTAGATVSDRDQRTLNQILADLGYTTEPADHGQHILRDGKIVCTGTCLQVRDWLRSTGQIPPLTRRSTRRATRAPSS